MKGILLLVWSQFNDHQMILLCILPRTTFLKLTSCMKNKHHAKTLDASWLQWCELYSVNMGAKMKIITFCMLTLCEGSIIPPKCCFSSMPLIIVTLNRESPSLSQQQRFSLTVRPYLVTFLNNIPSNFDQYLQPNLWNTWCCHHHASLYGWKAWADDMCSSIARGM